MTHTQRRPPRNKLKTISTATVATALFKRGFSNPVHSGRASARPGSADAGGRGVYACATCRAARGSETRLEVFSRPLASAAQGGGRLSCWRGLGHGQPQGCPARRRPAPILVTRLMQRGRRRRDYRRRIPRFFRRKSPSSAFPAYHHRPRRADQSPRCIRRSRSTVRSAAATRRYFPAMSFSATATGVIVIPGASRRRDRQRGVRDDGVRGFLSPKKSATAASILGLYPATDEQTLTDFAAWRKKDRAVSVSPDAAQRETVRCRAGVHGCTTQVWVPVLRRIAARPASRPGTRDTDLSLLRMRAGVTTINDREITMLMFNNLIDGEWMSDGARSPKRQFRRIPMTSSVRAVRGTPRTGRWPAVAAAKAAFFRAWSRSTPQVRYEHSQEGLG